ncbi:hypothetical protein Q5752_004163 [Cryptotrichosporon argae]
MTRRRRLADAQCAICMDALFDHLDDLDETMAIATAACGHVFHETCLLSWFRTQAQAYVAREREWNPRAQLSDAPAECPTCRAECFANDDTGEPAVYRLYINFGDDGMPAGPSSGTGAGSSPVRPTQTQTQTQTQANRKGKGRADQEVLALARRAKALVRDVEGYGPESMENDVKRAIGRVSSLVEDSLSSKAAAGFKTYVISLRTALDALCARLEMSPLVATLHADLALARSDVESARILLADTNRKLLGERARAAKADDEAARALREAKRAGKERDTMEKNYQLERQRARALQKGREEERALAAKTVDDAKAALHAEKKKVESLEDTLRQRAKQIRVFQSKAESRTQLHARIAALEAEVALLRAHTGQPTDPIDSIPSRAHDGPDADVSGNASIEAIDPPAGSYARMHAAADDADESLVVDRSYDLSLGFADTSVPPRSRTAREITFNARGPVNPSRSKWFAARAPPPSLVPGPAFSEPDLVPSSPARPARPRFTSSSPATICSSPDSTPSSLGMTRASRQGKRAQRAPAPASPRPSKSPRRDSDSDVVDVSSSPLLSPMASLRSQSGPHAGRPPTSAQRPQRPPTLGDAGRRLNLGMRAGPDVLRARKSGAEALGLVDRTGRPRAGVVSGPKVKRRL